MSQSMDMVRVIYNALADKKGEDIKVIDISEISVMADYFIIADGTNASQVQAIANGNSDSQVSALVENVDEKTHAAGYGLKQQEGARGGAWILLDYGDVIVHVFGRESRSFYNLEHVWSDGKIVEM